MTIALHRHQKPCNAAPTFGGSRSSSGGGSAGVVSSIDVNVRASPKKTILRLAVFNPAEGPLADRSWIVHGALFGGSCRVSKLGAASFSNTSRFGAFTSAGRAAREVASSGTAIEVLSKVVYR